MNRMLLTTLLAFLSWNLATGQSKPNILVLLVDDLGYHDLGCTGSEIYQTPNIDKLSSASVTFTNAYANYPRCVPSRYAMVTGTYPISGGEVPDDGFSIQKVREESNPVRNLGDAGYKTAFFGKWHLGDGESSPVSFGYDISFAAGKAGSPMSYFFPFNEPKNANRNVRKAPIEDVDEIAKEGDYLTDVMTNECMRYISETAGKQPFLAMLSFYAVHQPLEAKKDLTEENRKEIDAFDFGDRPAYKQEGTGRTKLHQDNPAYAAMVENLDWNIGRILKLLADLGIEDNTLVIFTSDHGGLSNDGYNKRNLATSNFPLRAGKGWMYEGGTRVPLFIHYPGIWQPRQDTNSIVMLMDLFPTLVDFTSGQALQGLDGRSLVPVLNSTESWNERTVFWHASSARPRNTGESRSSAIRSGDWKLVHFYDEDRIELYNLKQDPYEEANIEQDYPQKAKSLLEKLNDWKAKS